MIIYSMISRVLVLGVLLALLSCTYLPQLRLSTQASFINQGIKQFGSEISDFLNNNITIPTISYDDKVEGIRVQLNLSDIYQNISLEWDNHLLAPTDTYNFTVSLNNINVTLDSEIQFKISLLPAQKQNLTINITKLDTNVSFGLIAAPCDQSVGFSVEINNIEVSSTYDIHISNTIENVILKAIKLLLKSRLPSLIDSIAKNTINPLISQLACSPIEETVKIGSNNYVVYVNTTQIPRFNGQSLDALVDLTIQNLVTNKSNPEIQNDNMPAGQFYPKQSNVSLALSNNMLNTIVWLVEDSLLSTFSLTAAGFPALKTYLKTDQMTILLPALRQWPNREVALMISPSKKADHVDIYNGRLSVLARIAIQFVVSNSSASIPKNPQECLTNGKCFAPVQLGLSLSLAAALKLLEGPLATAKGLVQDVSIQEIEVMHSTVDVNTKTLALIINSVVSSLRPQINTMLQQGVQIDPDSPILAPILKPLLQKYHLKGILANLELDYAAVGILFDI